MSFTRLYCRICLLVLVALTGFPSVLITGCSHDNNHIELPETGLFTKSILVNGTARRYAYYIPANIRDSAVPIVFSLHGGGVYIEDMTGASGYKTPYKIWMDIAETENIIVIYPEGLNGVYGKPTWNDCRANAQVSSTADDVHFIDTLIDIFTSTYQIDSNRIYVSGTSNGGLMALRLAVELSDRIAAVAAIVASMPDSSECGPLANHISVLFMNGTADTHLPYNGGIVSDPPNPDYGTVYSTEESVHIWTMFNQTDTIPIVYSFPDINTNDSSTVTKYMYANGIEGTEVILYKVIGGGHSAPSIREQYSSLYEQYFGKQNHDIEMVTEVWEFFSGKTLGSH